MRHADIKTTEKYYAIENANDAAASLHDRFGHLDETENEIAKELSVDRAN